MFCQRRKQGFSHIRGGHHVRADTSAREGRGGRRADRPDLHAPEDPAVVAGPLQSAEERVDAVGAREDGPVVATFREPRHRVLSRRAGVTASPRSWGIRSARRPRGRGAAPSHCLCAGARDEHPLAEERSLVEPAQLGAQRHHLPDHEHGGRADPRRVGGGRELRQRRLDDALLRRRRALNERSGRV